MFGLFWFSVKKSYFRLVTRKTIMKIKILAIGFLLFAAVSCEFNKSINKDFVTGITTKGDGLSCDHVSLSDGKNEISRTSFTYGQTFYLNFNDIKGFKKIDNNVFSGLKLIVLGVKGDTIMFNNDLYASNNGIDISPLLLQTKITVANPIHSNNKYRAYVNIWDKKGEGTFSAEMDFDVVPNNQIKIESNNISHDEVYLFSREGNVCITNNKVKFNENIFMMFEGLEGFILEDGKAYLGLSIKGKDSEGEMILNEEDLIGDSVIEASELKRQLAPNFIFSGSNIKNPIACEIIIWDKKSDNKIKASIDLNVK